MAAAKRSHPSHTLSALLFALIPLPPLLSPFFLSFSRQDGSLTDWEERGGFKRYQAGNYLHTKNGCGMRRGATCGVRRGAVCGMRRAVRHGVRRVAACGEARRAACGVGGWVVGAA
jgi:hypothetical protein